MPKNIEKTFVMIKPDAVQKRAVGEIVSRFEKKCMKIVAMKLIHLPKELVEKNYAEHKGKPFYDELIRYITSGPVVTMVIEGDDAVNVVRGLVGATNPKQAAPGTIRCDFGMDIGRNVIHASDSRQSADREISVFFTEKEIVKYKRIDEDWTYADR